jgi:heptaprenyl diphosphate synthase
MAAGAIAQALDGHSTPDAALDAYTHGLQARFGERFHAGRQLVRHYGFLWKLLQTTSQIENRLFDGLRFALVDYGTGKGRARARVERFESPNAGTAAAGASVAAQADLIHARLGQVVDSGFPLLSRICEPLLDTLGVRARVQMLLLACQCGAARPDCMNAALALELAHLAFAIHGGIRDQNPELTESRPSVRWGNLFTVTAGDGMLAKAYEYAAGLGPAICADVSRTSAQVYQAQAQQIVRAVERVASVRQFLRRTLATAAPFSRLACRLGASLSGCPRPVVAALEAFGQNMGVALTLAEETQTLSDPAARGAALRASVELGELPLSLMVSADYARFRPAAERTRTDAPWLNSESLLDGQIGIEAFEKVGVIARRYVARGRRCLERIPPGSARAGLDAYALSLARRCLGPAVGGNAPRNGSDREDRALTSTARPNGLWPADTPGVTTGASARSDVPPRGIGERGY